jgi:hypothetical protein
MRANSVLFGFTIALLVLCSISFISWQAPDGGIKAIVDIVPDTLNLKEHDGRVTVRVQIPDRNVSDINITTVRLEFSSVLLQPIDWNAQGNKLLLKFASIDVINLILSGIYHMGRQLEWREALELRLTGQFYDGTIFAGTDTIHVILPPP